MTKTQVLEKEKIKFAPKYHVIILNDDFHTFEYVIRVLKAVFGYQDEKCFQLTKETHDKGRAIVYTDAFEIAEFKQDQIHSFGPDPLMKDCKGSITAVLEPAP